MHGEEEHDAWELERVGDCNPTLISPAALHCSDDEPVAAHSIVW